LADLKEPVRFRLFMSSALTNHAPQVAAFAQRVRSLLDAYVAGANGKIVLEVIDPRPFSEDEDRAVAFGIDCGTGPAARPLLLRPCRPQLDPRPRHHRVVLARPRAVPGIRPRSPRRRSRPPRQAGGGAARRSRAVRESRHPPGRAAGARADEAVLRREADPGR